MRDYIFELVDVDDPDIAKRKRATRKILLISLTCIFIAVVLIAIVIGVVMKDQADRKLLRTDEEGQTQPSDSSILTSLLASSLVPADTSLHKQTSTLLITPHTTNTPKKSIDLLTDSLLIQVSSSTKYYTPDVDSAVISPSTYAATVVNTNTQIHTDSLPLIPSIIHTLDTIISAKSWMNSVSEIQKSAKFEDSTHTVTHDYLITPSSVVEFESSVSEYEGSSSSSMAMNSSESLYLSVPDSVILQISTDMLQIATYTAPNSTDISQISTAPISTDISQIYTAPISTDLLQISTAPIITDLSQISTAPISTDISQISTAPNSTDISQISTAPISTVISQISTAPNNTDILQISTVPISTDISQISTAPISTDISQISTAPNSIDISQISTPPNSTDILQISTAPNSTDILQISTAPIRTDVSQISTAPISTGFHLPFSKSQISSVVTDHSSESFNMMTSSDDLMSYDTTQSSGLPAVYKTSVISTSSMSSDKQSEIISHAGSNSTIVQHLKSHTSLFSDGSPIYSTAPPVLITDHNLTTFSTVSSHKPTSSLKNLLMTSQISEYPKSLQTTQTDLTSVLSKAATSRSVSEKHIYSLLQITSTASASAEHISELLSDNQILLQTSFIELAPSHFPSSSMSSMEGDASINTVLTSNPAVLLASEIGGSTKNPLESTYLALSTVSKPVVLLSSEAGGSSENILGSTILAMSTVCKPAVWLTSEVGGSTENVLESSYTVPFTVDIEIFSPLSSVAAALHVITSQLLTSSTTELLISSTTEFLTSSTTELLISSNTVYLNPSFTLNITKSPFVVFTPGETESEGMTRPSVTMTAPSVTMTRPPVTMTRPPVTNATAPVSPTVSAATSSLATTTMTTVKTTTTSSIAQTTVTPCPGDKFGCDDGTCINKLWYCDGRVHCPDGSDETQNCKCGDGQMTCASGQCVAMTARCDKIYQCHDKSDEYNCTGCLGSQCASGLCLWRFARCDHKVDCEDLSDELNCPFRLGYRRCDNGMWVIASDWCDGVDNCYDNSDETSCNCDSQTEVKCLDNTCIRKEWVCDGHIDCVNMTDELSCSKCNAGEFQCHDYSCVAMDTVCDGKPDCKDGRDEMDCYVLQGSNSSRAGQTYLRRGTDLLPVCSTYWTADVSNLVCQKLGHQKAEETEFAPANNTSTSYYQLTEAIQHTEILLSHLTKVSQCSTDQIVKLNCMQKECGKRQDTVIAYIAGAELSPRGRWPWVASLSYLGQPICAAAIISEQWLVTAGHCVTSPGSHDHSQTPFYVEALLGSVKRTRDPDIGSSIIRVDKIVTHPDFLVTDIGPILWDIALLHLETRIQFTDFIQPICLPDKRTTGSHCFLAGWGKIDSNQAVTPEYLREAKLNLWSDEDCEKNTVHMEVKVNTNITLCAGYSAGVKSACQGDSGGPLMCEDTRGRWYLAGITSSGAANCGVQTSRADRFTRISGVIDWIRNITMVT